MYRRGLKGYLKHFDFLILDVICVQLSFVLSYFIRFDLINPYDDLVYRDTGLVLCLIAIVVSVFIDTYNDVLKRGYLLEFIATFKQMIVVELLAMGFLFATHSGNLMSRLTIFYFGIIYFISSYIIRVLWKKVVRERLKNYKKRATLVVTVEDRLYKTIENVVKSNGSFRVAGIAVIDKDMKGETVSGVPIVAGREDLFDYVHLEWIDEVLIDLTFADERINPLTDKFLSMGVVVHTKLPRDKEYEGRKQFIDYMGKYTVLTTAVNYASTGQLLAKRALDILGGLVGCLITLILIVVLGPIIAITDPGPLFFKQERVGKNGRKFYMYKFRSMYTDAEARKAALMEQNQLDSNLMFKMENDPRIIGSKLLPDGTYKKGIGNYMRDFSLDEFPQFFNVLKGDMSLVGTRPPTVDEWKQYDLHHNARLAIKPGITGMWQVSGRSKITDFEEVVKLDTQYIQQWSVSLDIKILFKTIGAVFEKDGAM